MSDEWQGWSREFPSREAVEAHVAASPPPPYASAWATGAPWLRVSGCGDLVVIYLAVIDGEVRERFGGDAAWHSLEMGRAGMWRPITALGESSVRSAGPIIEALDAAAVRLARENAAMRDELRAARETIEARDAEYAATLTATLTPPVGASPPWWQRAWFRVDRDDAAQRWQWVRRAIGGRWSPQVVGDFMEVAMQPCATCPCECEPYFFGLFESPDDARERWGVCSRRLCLCEVWP